MPVSGCRQERSARIHPPCPHGDQPERSCLRLVEIGETRRVDETLLELLTDVMQVCGLLALSEG